MSAAHVQIVNVENDPARFERVLNAALAGIETGGGIVFSVQFQATPVGQEEIAYTALILYRPGRERSRE